MGDRLTPDEQDRALRLQASLAAQLYREVAAGRPATAISRLLRALRELVAMPYETERTVALSRGRVPPSREGVRFSERRAA